MNPLFEPILGIVSQVLGLIGSEQAQSFNNQLVEIKLAILAEKQRGYDADDSKIENLEKQVPILLEGIRNELAIFQSRGPVSPGLGGHPVPQSGDTPPAAV